MIISNSFAISKSDAKNSIVKEVNVSNHWKTKFQKQIQILLAKHHHLFHKKLESFNNEIKMLIHFINEKNIRDLKKTSYSQSRKSRIAMNEILNFMKEQHLIEKISLKSKIALIASLFIIWNNFKLRVVVDLRKINTKLFLNVYSLSQQDEMLKFLEEVMIVSLMNVMKSFFQQRIKKKNRWKTIFTTSYQELKHFKIASIKLVTTSRFFQQRMKSILIRYLWIFVLIYTNDIIVYSRFTQNHLLHLKVVFTALKWFEISLSLFKCHFEYSLIALLKHHISWLRVFTIENKIKVIKKLTFSDTLQQLKNNLSVCEYYQSFVLNYAAIMKLLKWLKTIYLRSPSRKK